MGLWIGLGALGLTAMGSVYGLYRLGTLYVDFGPAAAELPGAVRAYRAQGLPFVAGEVAPAHPAPKDDATPSLRAALKALPGKKRGAELTKAARSPDRKADPILKDYERSLALVGSAVGRTRVDFGRNWDLGPYVLFPEYSGMKTLARAATVRAVRAAQRGDDAAAVRDLVLAQRIARWADQEPTLISMLVRIATESIELDGVLRCLASAKGDRARIARYAAFLRQAPPLPSFRNALRGEAWMGVTCGRNLDRFGGTRALAAQTNVEVDARVLRHDGLPDGTRQRAMMTRVLQVWTEAARETDGFRAPPMEIGRKLGEIEARWSEKKGLSRVLVMVLFPVVSQAGKAVVAVDARRAVALGFAEALDVQARTGRWPASVSVVDPFTGKALHVKRTTKDFRVYSVGRDLKDDGGLHRREAPKREGATSDEVAVFPPPR